MAMKRFAVVLGLVVLAGACEKPSEDSCRKALANVRALLGTEAEAADVEGDVRRCKGGSSKKNVECAINATSIDQLKTCGFFKIPEKKAGDPAAGSAPAPAAGSAPAADPAPGAGSAPAPAAGSAN
jgi:hypothetical protein